MSPLFRQQTILGFVAISICCLADILIEQDLSKYARAVIDNVCHASIALIAWKQFYPQSIRLDVLSWNSRFICPRNTVQVQFSTYGEIVCLQRFQPTDSYTLTIHWSAILSMLLGSLVDIDHFIVAGSTSLESATKLDHRPFLHQSFYVLIVICLMCAIRKPKMGVLLGMPVLLHHLRDSYRRGIWIGGSLEFSPTPYWFYLFATGTSGIICNVLFSHMQSMRPTPQATTLTEIV